MNKHINSFNTIEDYNNNLSNLVIPTVSYIKTTKTVIYDAEFAVDKSIAQVGWIAYNQNGTTVYYNPKSPEVSSLTKSDIIGIVVIPFSHTTDNTVRVVSMDFMDYNNPTTGSTSPVTMLWGYNEAEVPNLTSVNKVATYVSGTTTVSLAGSGHFGTDYDLSTIPGEFRYSACIDNDNFNFISWYNDTNYGQVPVPYTKNNGISSVYFHTNGSILSQGLCGSTNTDAIMAAVNHEGNITNEHTVGHYPAAECCRAYKDGSWYLPSIAELGYLCARIKEIDAVRSLLGYFTKLVDYWYWSSSLCSSYIAWLLHLGLYGAFGYCYNNPKGNNYRVLAFVAL